MEAKYWEETRSRRYARTDQNQRPSIGDLFGRLSDEFSRLIRLEIQLAKTELSEKAAVVGQNAGMIVGGVILALVGLTVLAIAIGYLLGTFMPLWLGFLLTAVLFAGIGGALAASGISTLKETSMQLDRTARTIEEDKLWMRQEAEEVKEDPAHLGQPH